MINRFRLCALVVVFTFTFISMMEIHGFAAETFRVGALMELSGGGAPWGIPSLRGLELMAEKINGEGGIRVGDKKYLIELVKADDKSNFDTALAQANRLIFDEKVTYINGPIISGCVLSILPVTEANKVIDMNYAVSPKVLGPDKPYSFRLYPAVRECMQGVFIYLSKSRPDVKTVALIGPNDESGWGNSKLAKEMAKEVGVEVIFEDFVQRGTTDFFPVLTKMVAKKPDALIPHAVPGGETALILQQSYQLGYRKMVITPSHYDPKTLVAKVGTEAAEGFIFMSPDWNGPTATPAMREVFKRYEEKYKEKFDPIIGPGYPQLHVLKMAIEKAGTFDTTLVMKTMENLEGEMPYGRFSMGGMKTYGAKRQIVYPIFLSQIKRGVQVGLGSVTPPVP